MSNPYPRVARFKTAEAFRAHLATLEIALPFDDDMRSGPDSPLAQPYTLKDGTVIGNRFAVQPMEGWDGQKDGNPSDNTIRRWTRFGRSGAKLIWGGEACAIRHDGRANPDQIMIQEHTLKGLEALLGALTSTHREHHGTTDDLMVGLQLTHSGRFARPNEKTKLEPMILYHHPLLEANYNVDPNIPVLTDMEIEDIIADFVIAARRAYELGFGFIDIKHCHGYLGHEFLSAFSRPGPYGGSFENRTRFLKEIVAGVRREVPDLRIGVRLSAFDFPPFRPDEENVGRLQVYANDDGAYPFAFGGDPSDPLKIMREELFAFLDLLVSLDIELVNLSCGSPYYNPHIMRPATFPPSDGYLPPEDPLLSVARQIDNVAQITPNYPDLAIVGTGYSYLQDWLPNVAQHVIRNGKADFIGLGRMILSYPDMPADVLAGNVLARKRICRTFSDCTTAPRNGMISGCYPLDDYYKELPEAEKLKAVKAES